MSEMATVRRSVSEGWRTAVWAVGAATCASVLAMVVFVIGIGIAEVSASAFGFTERAGVPIFTALIAVAVVAYGTLLHLIVRSIGRSAEVPWAIWPAMAAVPTAWVFIVLASGSDALQSILAVMQLLGIAIAFVTLGDRRWTKGVVGMTFERSRGRRRVHVDRGVTMRSLRSTVGLAALVLVCLAAAGTVAASLMAAGPYLLMHLFRLQKDWQISVAVAAVWFLALAPIIAAVCGVACAVDRRGGSTTGLMLGVAAYPAVCLAFVVLAPESWIDVRWIAFAQEFVAIPVAIGIAVTWALIRPRGTGIVRPTDSLAPDRAVRWRPVP